MCVCGETVTVIYSCLCEQAHTPLFAPVFINAKRSLCSDYSGGETVFYCGAQQELDHHRALNDARRQIDERAGNYITAKDRAEQGIEYKPNNTT